MKGLGDHLRQELSHRQTDSYALSSPLPSSQFLYFTKSSLLLSFIAWNCVVEFMARPPERILFFSL